MTPIHTLWLPILLSSVGVFILSSIVHMFLPWHKNDYPKVPDEDKVRNVLKPLNIPPGEYMVPRTYSMKELKTPEFQQKMNDGPVLVMTVRKNGMVPMAPSLIKWFIYVVVVGILVSYVAGRALPLGATYLHVFRFAGVTAFIAYVVAHWEMPIWWFRSLSLTIKSTVDGLIYALVTAGFFGWLWPR